MEIKNLLLQKNDKYQTGGKIPYFRLVLPPAEDGGAWIDLGAFWLKEKNGKKYYSGSIDKKYRVVVEAVEDNEQPPD